MLLVFLLLYLTAVTLANPFHKYPYVFLLDVGNEELEKVNTELIRISKQGGSLAVRYPAIGYGDNIAHVRVSGIDFGTDLKASIVDGGPGYQYVVLVLMGNPGVNFDAVITVQTLPKESDEGGLQNIDNSNNNTSDEDDPNDSAEDLSDSAESEDASQMSVKENSEQTQESSNVYSYAVNEALSGYGSSVHDSLSNVDENSYEVSEDDDETVNKKQDIHVPYKEDEIKIQSDLEYNEDTNNELPSSIESQSQESQHNNDYPAAVDDQNYSYENQDEVKYFEQYENSREPYYSEEVYPPSAQRSTPDDSGIIYIEEPGDNDQPLNLEEILSDKYADDEGNGQFSDRNNNNFIDRNDGSAVAY